MPWWNEYDILCHDAKCHDFICHDVICHDVIGPVIICHDVICHDVIGHDVTEISKTGSTVLRPRSRFSFIESQFWDRDPDFFLVISTTRVRPRLFFQSLNFETEIETFFSSLKVETWTETAISLKISLQNRKIIYTPRFSGRFRYHPWQDSIHV